MIHMQTRSPVTVAVFNGFSALSGAMVRLEPDGARLHLRGGRLPFDADDILVLQLIEAEDGFGPLTAVVGLEVYSGPAEVKARRPRLVYSGGPCPMDGVGPLLGPGHVGFDAGGLVPHTGGAPRLGQMLFAPGLDLRQPPGTDRVLETRAGLRARPDPSRHRLALARDALVETPAGPRYADGLRPGDLVRTAQGLVEPVTGARTLILPAGRAIRLGPGARGNLRELVLAPDQIVTLPRQDHMMTAAQLADGGRVRSEPVAARPGVLLEFAHPVTLVVEGIGLTSDSPAGPARAQPLSRVS